MKSRGPALFDSAMNPSLTREAGCPVRSLLVLVLSALLLASQAGAAQRLVYFGTYTGAKSKGIYVSRFDSTTGSLSAPALAAETASPSYLAAHPGGEFLYAVNEVVNYDGKKAGSVAAFAIDRRSGRLKLLNQQSSGGAAPCHLVVDKAGRNVLAANYGGGSVTVLPVNKDGSLKAASSFVQHTGSSVNKSRQEGPHAHGIYLDAANRFAYAPDLGLDKILIYRFDATRGALEANTPAFGVVAAGSGPRHFAMHPGGRFAYVINEIVCTVTAFNVDAMSGELKEVQTLSTLPDGEKVEPAYSTAELFAHPSGRFLYGSNRGHDTIAVYAVDTQAGRLTPVENAWTQGRVPRSFGIDPTGNWLLAANQNSDTIVVFRIDSRTGRLSSTSQVIEVGSPVSVEFIPAK